MKIEELYWTEVKQGTMPEDLTQTYKVEINGHQFIDTITDFVYVTDQFKKEIKEARRAHMTHPAYGSKWFWQSKERINLNDNFEPRYWSAIKFETQTIKDA